MEDNFIKIRKWLYPFSFLYGIGVKLRNKFFDWGILRSRDFDIPVISIGNITVGGTGKTPHTEYLIKLLQPKFNVAVLSRGYKRKSKGFILSRKNSSVEQIGDEPYQMKQKFPDIHVAVDKNRCHGIDELRKENISPQPEIVLLDDAFQHRYVQPGINILLIDFYRLICDDALLPAGHMREPARGKNRAHIVIVTKCPSDIKPVDFRVISKRINLYPYQKLFFTTFKYKNLVPLYNKKLPVRSITELQEEKILLVTGIASPRQMAQDLENYSSGIETLVFNDHHAFTREDIEQLQNRFNRLKGSKKLIITTEKDAARLLHHPDMKKELKPYIYYLPIEVDFLQNQQEVFDQTIIEFIQNIRRNNSLSKHKI